MKREEKEKQAIDRFYGEGEKTPYLVDQETMEFSRRMEDDLVKMHALDQEVPLDFTLQIDVGALVNEGMQKREQRKQQEETKTFILSALIIVLSSVIWGIVFGWKNILIWQWILLLPITFVIVPFMKKHNRKEVG